MRNHKINLRTKISDESRSRMQQTIDQLTDSVTSPRLIICLNISILRKSFGGFLVSLFWKTLRDGLTNNYFKSNVLFFRLLSCSTEYQRKKSCKIICQKSWREAEILQIRDVISSRYAGNSVGGSRAFQPGKLTKTSRVNLPLKISLPFHCNGLTTLTHVLTNTHLGERSAHIDSRFASVPNTFQSP